MRVIFPWPFERPKLDTKRVTLKIISIIRPVLVELGVVLVLQPNCGSPFEMAKESRDTPWVNELSLATLLEVKSSATWYGIVLQDGVEHLSFVATHNIKQLITINIRQCF